VGEAGNPEAGLSGVGLVVVVGWWRSGLCFCQIPFARAIVGAWSQPFTGWGRGDGWCRRHSSAVGGWCHALRGRQIVWFIAYPTGRVRRELDGHRKQSTGVKKCGSGGDFFLRSWQGRRRCWGLGFGGGGVPE